MRNIVLDTNCLLVSLPKKSPFRVVWDSFLAGKFVLCCTTEILDEYEEILGVKTTSYIARNIIKVILERPNTMLVDIFYRFQLIVNDPDDNKFVDCAVAAGAEYIVSNDSHFNVLKDVKFPVVDVVHLDTFAKKLTE